MNCIHFLNTGASDCIILESDGHFAMVDAAEDTEYPPDKPALKYRGYEEEICAYLHKNCSDENGIVTLDFVLGTHAHSDHIGGFDTVIHDDRVVVKKAFLKPYVESGINLFERTQWDNKEVYNQMRDALINKNVPIYTDFDGYSFKMGVFQITFFNGSYVHRWRPTGENENSVVTLVEAFGKRALLSGDMNWKCGGEKKIAKAVGKVDLLKVGHHGYDFSTSAIWLKTLDPDIAVLPNKEKQMHKSVAARIKKYSKAKLYATVDNNGVKAIFSEKGIDIKTDIM